MPKPKPMRVKKKKPAIESDTIFFYLPTEQPYGVFCQWHASTITFPISSLSFLTTSSTAASTVLTSYAPTLIFTCAEQLYMFAKALFFADALACTRILATSDPKEQKKIGQRVANFSDEAWTRVKSRVAEVGNWYKFVQDEKLRGVLLGTGEKELAEASSVDRVWGIGFKAKDAEVNRGSWGENRLGRALMRVRGRCREVARREREGEAAVWDWDGVEDEGQAVNGEEMLV